MKLLVHSWVLVTVVLAGITKGRAGYRQDRPGLGSSMSELFTLYGPRV